MPKKDATQKAMEVAKETVERPERDAPRKVLLENWKREDQSND